MEHEKSLYKRHHELYNMTQSGPVSEDILTELNSLKYEIEQVERHKAKGIILRSKCRWTEEGEHNTSYFLRLEKNNFCNKVISQLYCDGNIIKKTQRYTRG